MVTFILRTSTMLIVPTCSTWFSLAKLSPVSYRSSLSPFYSFIYLFLDFVPSVSHFPHLHTCAYLKLPPRNLSVPSLFASVWLMKNPPPTQITYIINLYRISFSFFSMSLMQILIWITLGTLILSLTLIAINLLLSLGANKL